MKRRRVQTPHFTPFHGLTTVLTTVMFVSFSVSHYSLLSPHSLLSFRSSFPLFLPPFFQLGRLYARKRELIPALNMYERCREILEPLSVYVSQEYAPQDPLNALQHGNGNSNNSGSSNGNGGGGGGGGGNNGSGGGGGGGGDIGGGVGGSDPDVIRCMYCMAQICRQLRRYPTALSIYRNLFEIQQKEARREAREAAEEREREAAMAAMALAVVENGGGDEGSEEGEAAAAAAARAASRSSRRGMGGGAAVDIASTYFNMALVYKLQNETKKAIEYYMKAREVWAAHRPGGKADPDAVRLNNRFYGKF